MSSIKRGRSGLGRGLNALFEDEEKPAFAAPQGVPATSGRLDDRTVTGQEQGTETGAEIGEDSASIQRKTLPITILRPGQFQPRQVFDDIALDELAESIALHGVLQPILVRPLKDVFGEFEIIGGERRWRAAQKARLHDVPVIIHDLDDEAAMQIALIENLQREDLNPIEEAEAYQRLMNEFAHTQEKLASVVGKSRSHIANTVRLLNLPTPVRRMIRDGKLTAGHARALITSPDPEALARDVLEKGLSVRETEQLVTDFAGGKAGKARKAKEGKDVNTLALERDLLDKTGMKVTITSRHNAKGDMVGSVKVDFTSLDQLDGIIAALTAGKA